MIAPAATETPALDDDRAAALQRFEHDLRTVAGPGRDLALRRRMTARCRTALAFAAGVPDDALWTDLVRDVSAFLRRCAVRRSGDPELPAAFERLRRLVEPLPV